MYSLSPFTLGKLSLSLKGYAMSSTLYQVYICTSSVISEGLEWYIPSFVVLPSCIDISLSLA